MLGAALGYPVKLCVPSNVTKERKRLLDVYGAQIVWTSPMDGSDGAIREARRLYARGSGSLLLPGSVQQRRQLARALRRHRRRDPRADATVASPTSSPGSAPAARSWARAAGCAESKPDVRLISVQPSSPLPWARGPEAHGERDRPADLRSGAGRRGRARRDRGGLGHGPAPGARGRPVRRRLGRRRRSSPRARPPRRSTTASSSRSFPTAASATCPRRCCRRDARRLSPGGARASSIATPPRPIRYECCGALYGTRTT